MQSASVITIHLTSLRFFAYHGLYDSERKNGNDFEMNVSISFHHPAHQNLTISDTINYASVYRIIQEEMQKPRELLETFLDELAAILKANFPQITTASILLYKLTAPIKGLQGKVGVQLQRSYT